MVDPDALERETQRVGRELHAGFPTAARHPLKALDGRAMDYAASDEAMRAALFRFVDVVPACRSLDDLARHLTSFLGEFDERPPSLDAAMRLSNSKAGRAALGAAAAAGVKHMAHRFIIAESHRDVDGHLRGLWRHGVAASLDLLGEATVTAKEADAYAELAADAVRTIAASAPRWPARPRLEHDFAGAIPRANVSVKVSGLTPLLRPDAPERGKRDAAVRLRRLLMEARDTRAHLHIDMESVDSLDAVLELVLELLAEPAFADGPSAGIVLQAYLRESPQRLREVLEWARATPRAQPLTVRLVKGAYWDHEVVEARQHGWGVPVFEDKAESDRNFEALSRALIDAKPLVRTAIASHNLRSVSHAIAYNRLTGGDDGDVELQVLRGLGDDLQDALAHQGFRVRAYCPVGELVAGMAYLVRRLLENTANESFLSDLQKGTPIDELLAAP
jgi:proline dehydrogenase